MLSAGSLFVLSFSSFIFFSVVITLEEKRQKRFLLKSLRSMFDEFVTKLFLLMHKKFSHVVHHTIKLSWYYSLHSALKAILILLVGVYDHLERVFIQNRDRARRLRAEKRILVKETNHLSAIIEHKESTALTSNQKKKLRARKLERD